MRRHSPAKAVILLVLMMRLVIVGMVVALDLGAAAMRGLRRKA